MNCSSVGGLRTIVILTNHDLDFYEEGKIRPALLNSLSDVLGTVTASSDLVEQMAVLDRPHPANDCLRVLGEGQSLGDFSLTIVVYGHSKPTSNES